MTERKVASNAASDSNFIFMLAYVLRAKCRSAYDTKVKAKMNRWNRWYLAIAATVEYFAGVCGWEDAVSGVVGVDMLLVQELKTAIYEATRALPTSAVTSNCKKITSRSSSDNLVTLGDP